MFTPRGVTVCVAGVAMWFTARLIGSGGLEVVGIGLALLPVVAGYFLRWTERRVTVRRRLSEVRVVPGTRLNVQLDVENRSTAPSSFLMLEDQLPPALGRPARLVVASVPGRRAQRVSYSILPQSRGRYRIGPLTIDVSNPFGLRRRRLVVEDRDELLVTPEVEDLTAPPDAATSPNAGTARARQLLRTGEEYFTMRMYQEGDDLRRIHWPSVARTGELMIRQNETSKRANGLVFLDNREAALGPSHGAAFERAVSCAASIGALLAHNGFGLRFGTAESLAVSLSEDRFMDALAGVSHGKGPSLAGALTNLRASSSSEASLIFVAAPPAPQELPQLVRSGTGFGPKLAVLVHPVEPATAPASRRTQLEARSTQARLALVRAGWDCLVLTPSTRLSERWHTPRERLLASSV
jgi:uncharacterized protein (DUF58 family)